MVTELAIENSTGRGSLAVATDGCVVHTASFEGSGQLALAVARARREVTAFDRVIVGTGPGSYTGLRVAAATALGLQVAFNCELAGCPSVLGFAEDPCAVIGNARRGNYFLAVIRACRIVDGPRLVPTRDLRATLDALAPMPCIATTPVPENLPALICDPRADRLLSHPSSWTASVEPLYLKEPHITVTGKE
ncbi:MAG: tRNA (adenosine(37)-N6)-threonylcarbamoyltransferase complex dimerization subunit type 1 TsaB [Verrucomicrobia bacterium]|nr:tRNA (adenosine(37)-N6)-threonylcarbamoyltransferase complex dimerization subunit type 1 TsaB [Verrucomicrobiota bacterium]